MSHEQFYIIEEVGGHEPESGNKIIATTTEFEVGSTHTRSPNPSIPGTVCKVIAGPFELPEPMETVEEIEEWVMTYRVDLYEQYLE